MAKKLSLSQLRKLCSDAAAKHEIWPGHFWEHIASKGIYEINGIALTPKTLAPMIIYSKNNYYGINQVSFVRPLEDFVNKFKKIE